MKKALPLIFLPFAGGRWNLLENGTKKWKRLTYEDRQTIERMARSGASVYAIADALGKHSVTIERELAKCEPYSADFAQRATGSR